MEFKNMLQSLPGDDGAISFSAWNFENDSINGQRAKTMDGDISVSFKHLFTCSKSVIYNDTSRDVILEIINKTLISSEREHLLNFSYNNSNSDNRNKLKGCNQGISYNFSSPSRESDLEISEWKKSFDTVNGCYLGNQIKVCNRFGCELARGKRISLDAFFSCNLKKNLSHKILSLLDFFGSDKTKLPTIKIVDFDKSRTSAIDNCIVCQFTMFKVIQTMFSYHLPVDISLYKNLVTLLKRLNCPPIRKYVHKCFKQIISNVCEAANNPVKIDGSEEDKLWIRKLLKDFGLRLNLINVDIFLLNKIFFTIFDIFWYVVKVSSARINHQSMYLQEDVEHNLRSNRDINCSINKKFTNLTENQKMYDLCKWNVANFTERSNYCDEHRVDKTNTSAVIESFSEIPKVNLNDNSVINISPSYNQIPILNVSGSENRTNEVKSISIIAADIKEKRQSISISTDIDCNLHLEELTKNSKETLSPELIFNCIDESNFKGFERDEYSPFKGFEDFEHRMSLINKAVQKSVVEFVQFSNEPNFETQKGMKILVSCKMKNPMSVNFEKMNDEELVKYKELEILLGKFIKDKSSAGYHLSETVCLAKARDIASSLNIENFSPNRDWLVKLVDGNNSSTVEPEKVKRPVGRPPKSNSVENIVSSSNEKLNTKLETSYYRDNEKLILSNDTSVNTNIDSKEKRNCNVETLELKKEIDGNNTTVVNLNHCESLKDKNEAGVKDKSEEFQTCSEFNGSINNNVAESERKVLTRKNHVLSSDDLNAVLNKVNVEGSCDSLENPNESKERNQNLSIVIRNNMNNEVGFSGDTNLDKIKNSVLMRRGTRLKRIPFNSDVYVLFPFRKRKYKARSSLQENSINRFETAKNMDKGDEIIQKKRVKKVETSLRKLRLLENIDPVVKKYVAKNMIQRRLSRKKRTSNLRSPRKSAELSESKLNDFIVHKYHTRKIKLKLKQCCLGDEVTQANNNNIGNLKDLKNVSLENDRTYKDENFGNGMKLNTDTVRNNSERFKISQKFKKEVTFRREIECKESLTSASKPRETRLKRLPFDSEMYIFYTSKHHKQTKVSKNNSVLRKIKKVRKRKSKIIQENSKKQEDKQFDKRTSARIKLSLKKSFITKTDEIRSIEKKKLNLQPLVEKNHEKSENIRKNIKNQSMNDNKKKDCNQNLGKGTSRDNGNSTDLNNSISSRRDTFIKSPLFSWRNIKKKKLLHHVKKFIFTNSKDQPSKKGEECCNMKSGEIEMTGGVDSAVNFSVSEGIIKSAESKLLKVCTVEMGRKSDEEFCEMKSTRNHCTLISDKKSRNSSDGSDYSKDLKLQPKELNDNLTNEKISLNKHIEEFGNAKREVNSEDNSISNLSKPSVNSDNKNIDLIFSLSNSGNNDISKKLSNETEDNDVQKRRKEIINKSNFGENLKQRSCISSVETVKGTKLPSFLDRKEKSRKFTHENNEKYRSLSNELSSFIEKKIEANFPLTPAVCLNKAKEIAVVKGIKDFDACLEWFQKFMQRQCFSKYIPDDDDSENVRNNKFSQNLRKNEDDTEEREAIFSKSRLKLKEDLAKNEVKKVIKYKIDYKNTRCNDSESTFQNNGLNNITFHYVRKIKNVPNKYSSLHVKINKYRDLDNELLSFINENISCNSPLSAAMCLLKAREIAGYMKLDVKFDREWLDKFMKRTKISLKLMEDNKMTMNPPIKKARIENTSTVNDHFKNTSMDSKRMDSDKYFNFAKPTENSVEIPNQNQSIRFVKKRCFRMSTGGKRISSSEDKRLGNKTFRNGKVSRKENKTSVNIKNRMLTNLENQLICFVLDRDTEQSCVSFEECLLKAKEIATTLNIENFSASSAWLRRFLKNNHISLSESVEFGKERLLVLKRRNEDVRDNHKCQEILKTAAELKNTEQKIQNFETAEYNNGDGRIDNLGFTHDQNKINKFSLLKKLRIIRDAEIHGNHESSRQHNVEEKFIDQWRIKKGHLLLLRLINYNFKTKVQNYPLLEKRLISFVKKRRACIFPMSLKLLVFKSKQLATSMKIKDYQRNKTWVRNFIKKSGIISSFRRHKG